MYQISEIVLNLQQRNYYIKMNHMLILHAILQHCGVAGDKVTDVLHVLSGVKLDSQYKTISKSLTSLGLTDQSVSSLLGILEMEGNYGKVASYLRCITKTRGEVGEMSAFGVIMICWLSYQWGWYWCTTILFLGSIKSQARSAWVGSHPQ